MTRRWYLIALVLSVTLAAAARAPAANIFVAEMDLTTFFDQNGELQSRGDFEISLDGGYKYRGNLMFQYLGNDLENDPDPSLRFYGANATARDVFGVMDFTYWTGYYTILGEGKHYAGHLYHRNSGFEYNGYLPLLGTGVSLLFPLGGASEGEFYLYQRYGSSRIDSLDVTLGRGSRPFRFALFAGVTANVYRLAGQVIWAGDVAEFYLTIGDPAIDDLGEVTYDDFYFLLEQWFNIGGWSLILSVFSRPDVAYDYIQRDYLPTNETNDIDFNFDLNFEPATKYWAVGTELNIQSNRDEELGVFISPYVDFFTSGIVWEIKVDVNVFSQVREPVTGYLNINASF
jgi:hypothetical protein